VPRAPGRPVRVLSGRPLPRRTASCQPRLLRDHGRIRLRARDLRHCSALLEQRLVFERLVAARLVAELNQHGLPTRAVDANLGKALPAIGVSWWASARLHDGHAVAVQCDLQGLALRPVLHWRIYS
jgi:hypothetical protein